MYVCRVYNVQYVNISEFVTSEFSSYREETGSVTREFSSYREGTGYLVHSASIEGSFDAPAIFCFLDKFFTFKYTYKKSPHITSPFKLSPLQNAAKNLEKCPHVTKCPME